MKKLVFVILCMLTLSVSAQQMTLAEKSALAVNTTFISRVTQALFSKANYWIIFATPTNLEQQKQINFAKAWVLGGANTSDVYAYTRYWLANYVADPPELYGSPSPLEGQPSDNAILNTTPLDVIYNTLAGVLPGDNALPPQ